MWSSRLTEAPPPTPATPGLPGHRPPGRALLRVQSTNRPYPLLDFLRISPLLRSHIAEGSPGIPLTLEIRLCDARRRPIPHAAVYIWHYDARGWTIDFQGDDLEAVTRMRGVQISDARGCVRFHTVYPGKYRDNSVPVYLQVYFNDGAQVVGRTDVCVLLPEQARGVLCDIPLAQPVPGSARKPHFNHEGDAALLPLDRLAFDESGGALIGEVCIPIDL